jgi:hypothetical protein
VVKLTNGSQLHFDSSGVSEETFRDGAVLHVRASGQQWFVLCPDRVLLCRGASALLSSTASTQGQVFLPAGLKTVLSAIICVVLPQSVWTLQTHGWHHGSPDGQGHPQATARAQKLIGKPSIA